MHEDLLEIFKARINTMVEEIREAQNTYLIAKAAEETIKEISEDIQRKILANGDYPICDKMWDMASDQDRKERRITNPDSIFLMDEKTLKNDFLPKCYEEYLKAGIADERGAEYIPEAKFHDVRVEAENILLKLAVDIIPDAMVEKEVLRSYCKHWKYRERLLDLILHLEV